MNKLAVLRRLITFAFRLGQLNERSTTLQYLSIMSADLPDEPETMKTRFILQQIGERISPGLMAKNQGIFGDRVNDIGGTMVDIIVYNNESYQSDEEFVSEMESQLPILFAYLISISSKIKFLVK